MREFNFLWMVMGLGFAACSPSEDDGAPGGDAGISTATATSSGSGTAPATTTAEPTGEPGAGQAGSPGSSATATTPNPTTTGSSNASGAAGSGGAAALDGNSGGATGLGGNAHGLGGATDAGADIDASAVVSDAGDAGSSTEPATRDAGDASVASPEPDASSEPAQLVDAGELPSLTISSDTSSIEFTPALYAAENLYPGEATVVTGGIPLLLSDDSIDLGTNAETQTLRRSVARPDLRIIFTVTETFYRIIARRSAGIANIDDLAGKTIGTPAQTSAAFYVFKTLSLAGLSIGDGADQVRVTSVFPGSGMVSALAGSNPSVDAVACWEPYPQLALDELGGTEGDGIVFQDRDVYREIVNLHSTTAKLDDPVIRRGIVAFVRSLMDATEWYRENPALAQQYVADELGHDAELIERVWEDEQFAGVLAPDLLDVLEEEELWLADQENREPRNRAELAPLIDDSIVAEALLLP